MSQEKLKLQVKEQKGPQKKKDLGAKIENINHT